MAIELYNIDVDAAQVYQQYQPFSTALFLQPVVEGGLAPVTTINGNSGQASGSTINLSGGATGYAFTASGNTLALSVANAATVRSSISAAKSGVNTDITELNGATQVDVSTSYKVSGTKVVGAQGAAVADATGLGDVVAQLNTLLARLRTHGLIAT